MAHGTFFPFFWQPPRPNLITYNFISAHSQHKRGDVIYSNRQGLRPGQPTVLRVQSPLFGVRLSVSNSHPNFKIFDNRPPIVLPIGFERNSGFEPFPSVRGNQYKLPFDARITNYLFRPPTAGALPQPSDFLFRTPLTPLLPPPIPPPSIPVRPDDSPNFLIPPNILIGAQSASPRPYPPFNLPPNLIYSRV